MALARAIFFILLILSNKDTLIFSKFVLPPLFLHKTVDPFETLFDRSRIRTAPFQRAPVGLRAVDNVLDCNVIVYLDRRSGEKIERQTAHDPRMERTHATRDHQRGSRTADDLVGDAGTAQEFGTVVQEGAEVGHAASVKAAHSIAAAHDQRMVSRCKSLYCNY